MTLRDADLVSIQQARELASAASEAQKKFSTFSQPQVDAIVEAVAAAALESSEQIARLAVEETGFGNVTDKMTKNEVAAVLVPKTIRGMKTVGILREDHEKGIIEIASPVGVVAAIIPCTNPTSTAVYKTLISLKARNAVVGSPHPSAVKCICETMAVLARAATKAGAPEGLISCMGHTTLQGTQELMRQRSVGVILATGGTGLVRAAYSSGKPAYGVGPGNVPAFIERTADVLKAVADIFAGKTFDYGTICSSEQAIVAEEAVAEQALEECRKQGAYFLTAEEIQHLGKIVFDEARHVPNSKIVGRPATMIAEIAGIKVPPSTRVLIAQLDDVGRHVPLSAEKLSPILSFYRVANAAAAFELCKRLLHFGGAGHTCSIHTQNAETAKEYGQAMPAFRVCVNTSAVHGSVGYATNLFPAMTLGCGAPGGNITSDNIGPQHLMNIKRVAWSSRPVQHRTIPANRRMLGPTENAALEPAKQAMAAAVGGSAVVVKAVASEKASGAQPNTVAQASIGIDRAAVARVIESVLAQKGITRGSGIPAVSSGASAPSGGATTSKEDCGCTRLPSPKEIAAAAAAAVFKVQAPIASIDMPGKVSSRSPEASKPSAPEVKASEPKIVPFVSEGDVRLAITRQEKIFVGPKTIITPSARDLASSHEVLIESKQE